MAKVITKTVYFASQPDDVQAELKKLTNATPVVHPQLFNSSTDAPFRLRYSGRELAYYDDLTNLYSSWGLYPYTIGDANSGARFKPPQYADPIAACLAQMASDTVSNVNYPMLLLPGNLQYGPGVTPNLDGGVLNITGLGPANCMLTVQTTLGWTISASAALGDSARLSLQGFALTLSGLNLSGVNKNSYRGYFTLSASNVNVPHLPTVFFNNMIISVGAQNGRQAALVMVTPGSVPSTASSAAKWEFGDVTYTSAATNNKISIVRNTVIAYYGNLDTGGTLYGDARAMFYLPVKSALNVSYSRIARGDADSQSPPALMGYLVTFQSTSSASGVSGYLYMTYVDTDTRSNFFGRPARLFVRFCEFWQNDVDAATIATAPINRGLFEIHDDIGDMTDKTRIDLFNVSVRMCSGPAASTGDLSTEASYVVYIDTPPANPMFNANNYILGFNSVAIATAVDNVDTVLYNATTGGNAPTLLRDLDGEMLNQSRVKANALVQPYDLLRLPPGWAQP